MRKSLWAIIACFWIATAIAGPHASWSYSGATGPAHWGKLSKAYRECSKGTYQSPINLDVRNTKTTPTYQFKIHYPLKARYTANNNGHTVEITTKKKAYIEFENKKYRLLQMHFHSPSEDTLLGIHYPAELHFVNQNKKTGKLTVVGVFVRQGSKNPALAKLLSGAPKKPHTKHALKTLNINKLLPYKLGHYYLYNGSLATPPCTEGVRWIIMQEPITASTKQIKALQSLYYKNNRPIQQNRSDPVLIFSY